MTAWDAELQQALDRQVEELWRGVAPDTEAAALRTALDEAVTGGKRLRPRLAAEVHEGLGGSRQAALVRAAAAIELLHTAFVVHDDLIDGDDVRRGAPSVPGRFRAAARAQGATARGAATYAVAGAVLTGDLALSGALRAVATLPAPADVTVQVLDRVTRALTTSAAGELTDVRLTLGGAWPAHRDVLELAYRKTADYSFVLPMQVGAVLADADTATVDILGEAGRSLGVAFQLFDDLAGMFDDAGSTGKDPVADLREGKLTLLVCHARSTPAWAVLGPVWGSPAATVDDVRHVRQALEESGSRAHVEDAALDHVRHGLSRAEEAGIGTTAAGWVASVLDRGKRTAA
ncbi:polyprenyl synthetase family protein [Xylanimonas oleitrophica]|uniref:Polyprenyl synthetase family protein n=1 Tax=Xylanimonas oleitrophica TaxID=2607479 RepID=A0A2W5X0G3_9MICO|nr:polyprenyl synthetase family protein [Xylanimonas oleitrophica]PZR54166.1 polyprenyl synthetase family protein [Xylanimonas oleitrophica]